MTHPFCETDFGHRDPAHTQFMELPDMRVSNAEQEEDEGDVLDALRWLVLCMIFVVLAYISVALGVYL